MQIAATCVRVPVLRSHSESLTVTFEDGVDADLDKVREVLNNFENVEVIDDLPNKKYPMPIISTDTDITYVGRIRKRYLFFKCDSLLQCCGSSKSWCCYKCS